MKAIIHHLKKDVTHQRWALLAWVALLIVHLLVSGFQILRHVPNPQPSTDQFADLVAAWVVFVPILFIILAVQSDTPAGTTAFWLTRPLRGGKMLVAKALYVALFFVLLPLAVEMAILLLRGAGTKAWLLVPEFSVVRLAVVLGAFALGASSQRFPQALTLAATGAIVSIATVLIGYSLLGGRGGGSSPEPFSGSRGIIALWTLAATFAAVVVLGFLTRRERRGRGLMVLGVAVAMILQLVWPWNLLGRPPRLAPDSADRVSVEIDPARVSMSTPDRSLPIGEAPTRSVAFPVDIVGGQKRAAGEFLAPTSGRVELVTADSSSLATSSTYDLDLDGARFRAALEPLLAPDRVRLVKPSGGPGSWAGGDALTHSFRMPDDEFARYQRELEELRVNVDVALLRLKRAGELPLSEGARWNGGGDEVELLQVQWTRNGLQLKVQTRVLSLIFADRDVRGRQAGDAWVLVLANDNTHTALVMEPSRSYSRSRTTGWLSPFVRSEKMFDLNLQIQLGRDYTPEAADDWRLNSRLIIVRRHQLGRLPVAGGVEVNAKKPKP